MEKDYIKAEKEAQGNNYPIGGDIAKELKRVVDTISQPQPQTAICKSPVNELMRKTFSSERMEKDNQLREVFRDLKNCRAVFYEDGTVENNLTCEECKAIFALQVLLSRQTVNIKDKIETVTESKRRHKKKDCLLGEKYQELKKQSEIKIINAEAVDLAYRGNPDFTGINLQTLSPFLLEAINEMSDSRGNKNIIIVTPDIWLSLMGKPRGGYSGEKIELLENMLFKFKNETFIRTHGNKKGVFSMVQKTLIKNYEILTSFVGSKTYRFYKIELSEIFTKNAANNYILLPPNYCEIIDKIKKKSFFNLFSWLLCELSENRRDENGLKTNHITAKAKRGETMIVCQPLKDEKVNTGTEENGRGLFSLLFNKKELAKNGTTRAKQELTEWLCILREFGFVRDFIFYNNQTRIKITLNRIKQTNYDKSEPSGTPSET